MVSCLSKKLNEAQKSYSVTKKELLILKHNHSGEIILYTDHKNLTDDDMKHVSQYVLHQCILIMQDYGAKLTYLEGGKKTGAAALSCLQTNKNSLEITMT